MSGGRFRRAWGHTWVRVVAVATALLLVLGALGGGWIAYRYRQLHREPVPSLERAKGGPQNFLLVGSDSREFVEGGAEATAFGTEDEVGEPHADTILLVRTFPDLGRVAIVSFPRDLWIPIAGTGGEDRINAAVQQGPGQLVQTITENFGIPVHHYAEIDFRGFRALVNAVGGVQIPFPYPARDYDEEKKQTLTGLDVPDPGCVRLDGDQALAYVRSRHFQQLIDGAWQPDPAGDLNRIQRQQDFIRRTFHQTLSRGLLDPRRVNRLLDVAIDNVALDDALGLGDIQSFVRQLGSLQPDALRSYALPTKPGTTASDAQVLFLDPPAAEPIFDVFRGRTTEPPVVLAGGVRVRVENGSGRSEQVRAAAAFRLAAAGFLLSGVGDASVADATTIRFADGNEAAATLVASHLVGPAVLAPDPAVEGVILVMGRDWKGVSETAKEPPPTTTTTAAPDATTTTATTAVPAPTC
jgi:LCP family protein required for cell wall assembly